MKTNDEAIITTGEPVTEQAPAALPADYLKDGYHIATDKARYPDPALVSSTAQRIATALVAGGMKPSAYNPLLRALKKANKRNHPFEAQRGALLALIPKAMLLVQKNRAPQLLVDMMQANLGALTDNDDFDACYQHLEAVSAFLALYQEGGDT